MPKVAGVYRDGRQGGESIELSDGIATTEASKRLGEGPSRVAEPPAHCRDHGNNLIGRLVHETCGKLIG